MQSLKTIALSFSVAALSSNVVINLIVGGLLSELWGMINSLQIIMHTLLFRIDLPVNAEQLSMVFM
jgi:hypothetical protein